MYGWWVVDGGFGGGVACVGELVLYFRGEGGVG